MGALPSGCGRGVPHRDGSEGRSPSPTEKDLKKPVPTSLKKELMIKPSERRKPSSPRPGDENQSLQTAPD